MDPSTSVVTQPPENGSSNAQVATSSSQANSSGTIQVKNSAQKPFWRIRMESVVSFLARVLNFVPNAFNSFHFRYKAIRFTWGSSNQTNTVQKVIAAATSSPGAIALSSSSSSNSTASNSNTSEPATRSLATSSAESAKGTPAPSKPVKKIFSVKSVSVDKAKKVSKNQSDQVKEQNKSIEAITNLIFMEIDLLKSLFRKNPEISDFLFILAGYDKHKMRLQVEIALTEFQLGDRDHPVQQVQLEIQLAKALGFDDESFCYDHALAYVVMARLSKEEIKGRLLSEEQQKAIQTQQYETRSKFIFGKQKHLTEKFELIRRFIAEMKTAFRRFEIALPADFPVQCKEVQRYLRQEFEGFKQLIIENRVVEFCDFKGVKKLFNDRSLSSNSFKEFLEDCQSRLIDTITEHLLQRAEGNPFHLPLIHFYRKYGGNIVFESFHGDNPYTATQFRKSVAIHLRLQRNSQRDPSNYIPVSNECQFHSRDREILAYIQKDQVPEDVVCIPLFKEVSITDLAEELKEQAKKLPFSKGWITLSLDLGAKSHVISLRLDQKHQRFWVFDRKIGMLAFTGNDGGQQAVACAIDLMSALNRGLKTISGDQFVYRQAKAGSSASGNASAASSSASSSSSSTSKDSQSS